MFKKLLKKINRKIDMWMHRRMTKEFGYEVNRYFDKQKSDRDYFDRYEKHN